jgi:sugar phosphate permease
MNHEPGGSTSRAEKASASESTFPANRWTILALLALAQLLGMSPWFTASAVSPQLSELWGLDAGQAGWLTTTVLLGFVAGTAMAAVLNLADVIPSRRYFAVSALLAAAVNAAVAVAPGFAIALPLRFLTGFFLAGVYPPAMKMIATWFLAGRGLAIGVIVGALTIGKALPYLITALEGIEYRSVIAIASAGAVVSALLVAAWYRDGPEPFDRRPFSWGLAGTVLTHRPTRITIAAYLGHMWELYAGWTGLSLFFYDFFLGKGFGTAESVALAGVTAFGAIAIGGLGSVLAGLWADRLGRENVASGAMVASGACALVIGWLMASPVWLVVTLAIVWGFAIVADSAQFSALVTEVAPRHAVGTALTLQTSLGFLLSAGTIWLMLAVEDRLGWGVAFSILAVGPLVGILQMRRLKAERGTTSRARARARARQVGDGYGGGNGSL